MQYADWVRHAYSHRKGSQLSLHPMCFSYYISSERRFTVCVGAHTLDIFLKNFPTGRKNRCMGTISQMVSPLYHIRKGLSSQDMMKQHMGIHEPLCSGTSIFVVYGVVSLHFDVLMLCKNKLGGGVLDATLSQFTCGHVANVGDLACRHYKIITHCKTTQLA